MLSDLSIKRPVLAAVFAILLCVLGLASLSRLPIRELPNVDSPVVSISTAYRGASAEVVEERITEVIERQVAGIQGIDRINSSSRDGQSRINVTFTLSTDLEVATNDIRDAISRVSDRLPDQSDPPQISKANSDSSPIIVLNMFSKSLSQLELADYADRYIVERLSTVPGVAQVGLNGAPLYAMRVWLQPDAMASRGLTVADVETALQSQNLELPAGALEGKSRDFAIRVNRGYATPEAFAQLPILTSKGSSANASAVRTPAQPYVTRLGDIAKIEEAADERRKIFRGDGVQQIGLGLSRQSQANDLEISRLVRAEVASINQSLPAGTQLIVAVDNSVFTSSAIHEVWITMAISLALVALVNLVFLGSWRAAVIPTVVAPICLLSALLVLSIFGFSLNLLTLLALVLSVGLVVDDAIVVVENIQRRIDEGEPRQIAALRGARQVFFAVVATTVVLISVFAPLLFLPGYTGRLFVELAVAIVAAVGFSALMALSLSPMLASIILKPATANGPISGWIDTVMDRCRSSYEASLRGLMTSGWSTVGSLGLVILLAGFAVILFQAIPKELVPEEDRGRVDVQIQAPEGSGFDYTAAIAARVEKKLATYKAEGTAQRYIISVPRFGQNQFNTASGVIVMQPEDMRTKTSAQVADELNKSLRSITGARVVASVRGPFQRGGGAGGGTSVELIARGNDYPEVQAWMEPILTAAQSNPGFSKPRLDYEPTAPRLRVDIDRNKAAVLGVSADAIGRVLETMFGSRRVTTYLKAGQEYNVILQTDLENRRSVSDLNGLYVKSGSGELVPLSALVTTALRGDAPDRPRVDRLRSISLTTQLTPGFTVEDAVSFLKSEVQKRPANGITIAWGGQAKDFLEASGSVNLAFGLALLLVFLVLAAQFESWINPAVIMLTVPLAGLGGLVGLLLAGSTINTYSQIGLIILIGIAAKNGILIVEFANQLRDKGMAITEAACTAAALRLRPIIMTSVASAFGALPLIVWGGAGAVSRQTIGVVIFTGVLFATVLTLFVVPVVYARVARFARSPNHPADQIAALEAGNASGS
jgi:multidrug efflux pump